MKSGRIKIPKTMPALADNRYWFASRDLPTLGRHDSFGWFLISGRAVTLVVWTYRALEPYHG